MLRGWGCEILTRAHNSSWTTRGHKSFLFLCIVGPLKIVIFPLKKCDFPFFSTSYLVFLTRIHMSQDLGHPIRWDLRVTDSLINSWLAASIYLRLYENQPLTQAYSRPSHMHLWGWFAAVGTRSTERIVATTSPSFPWVAHLGLATGNCTLGKLRSFSNQK